MGDLKLLGVTPDDVRIGSLFADKIYQGTELIYPPENPLPEWAPDDLEDVLENAPVLTDYYADFIYMIGNNYVWLYRIHCSEYCDISMQRANNHYQLFQAPFIYGNRVFKTSERVYTPGAGWNTWYTGGWEDRGNTAQIGGTTFIHRAVLNTEKFRSFSNDTGDEFEDYNPLN